MTGVRVDPAAASLIPAWALVAPAQAGDPALVRWIGLAAVGLLVLTLLVLVVRYGSDRGESDDSGGVFNPGPAYGLTGSTDVEDVLLIDDEAVEEGDDDASRAAPADDPDRTGGDERGSPDRAAGGDTGTAGGGTGDDGTAGDDAEFTHDVRERRDGEWLVEVTDGERSARFEVGRVGSVLTVDPVASPARRHGTGWVLRAEQYLRDQDLAVGTERE